MLKGKLGWIAGVRDSAARTERTRGERRQGGNQGEGRQQGTAGGTVSSSDVSGAPISQYSDAEVEAAEALIKLSRGLWEPTRKAMGSSEGLSTTSSDGDDKEADDE
jgi:hypothetical protein